MDLSSLSLSPAGCPPPAWSSSSWPAVTSLNKSHQCTNFFSGGFSIFGSLLVVFSVSGGGFHLRRGLFVLYLCLPPSLTCFFFASVCNMGIKMYIKFSLYTHSSKHTVVCCGCKSNLLLVLWMILLDSTIFKHLKC